MTSKTVQSIVGYYNNAEMQTEQCCNMGKVPYTDTYTHTLSLDSQGFPLPYIIRKLPNAVSLARLTGSAVHGEFCKHLQCALISKSTVCIIEG
jgi:hypothetical protein